MEDFYFAGGLPALLASSATISILDRPTVNGRTLGEAIAGAECWNDDVIRARRSRRAARKGARWRSSRAISRPTGRS